MRQEALFKLPPKYHGGKFAKGKRKSLRPLAKKKPIHLVLKSAHKLYGARAFIEAQVRRQSESAQVKLYDLAVAVDHVHIVIMIPGRREYKAFIRALAGILARKLGKKLWSILPFTRVANWGIDYDQLKKYLQQNREEAAGRRPYKPRKNCYKYATG